MLAPLLLFRTDRTVCRFHNLFPDSSTFPLENVKLRYPALGCGLNFQLVSKEENVQSDCGLLPTGRSKGTEHLPRFTGSLHQGVKLPGLWTLHSVEQLTPSQATSTRECTTLQEDPPAYPAERLEPNISTEYQKRSHPPRHC